MVYYNSDGKISTMCGNGGRCAMHYSYLNGISAKKSKFLACDGIHDGDVSGNFVRISLKDVNKYKFINDDIYIDTGSPHLVKILEYVSNINIL